MLGIGAREALGLQVDGQRVLVAHLRRQGRQVMVVGLRSASLASRLEMSQEGGAAAGPASPGDILGLAEEPVDKGTEEEGSPPETNTEVLYRLLERFPVKRCSLAFSLVESCVFFTPFEENFGLKGKRLKERLIAQTEKGRASAGTLSLAECHASFATGPQRLLSIIHEDPLELLGLLDSLTPFIGRVRVRSIEPLEVALMDLAKISYPAAEQVMAVVFVGEQYSRVIFMRQGECLAFSQPIHEGLASSQVLQTVYSRILYEQDNNDLPEIGQVVLAGGCKAIQAQPFFAGQFPQAQVDYLAVPELDLRELEDAEREQVSGFAVPIGLALKALCPQEKRLYPVNFLPRARRKQQNPFELAWHGLLLLALLAVVALGLGRMVQERERRLDELGLAVEVLAGQVRENAEYVKMVDDLNAQIIQYEDRFALLDTLEVRRLRWAERLGEVAWAVRRTEDIWLEKLSTAEGNLDVRRDMDAQGLPPSQAISLYGKALYRGRVPELAQRLGETLVRSSVRDQIRGRAVYQFDLRLPIVPPGAGR